NALRIQNNIANLVASADLKLQGTYDQPRLFGHAEVERGDLVFAGTRYTIPRGGIDFFNPSRIEPVFDIEAETRVRLPGTTYLVTVGFNGTTSRFSLPLNSDPPLPESDIISLLLGQTIDENPELRALRPEAARQTEESLLREAVARILTNPGSAPLSRSIGEKIGIDPVIAPTIGTESDPLSPSARLILGRRISNRAYLTFARALGTTQREQIIVLEYDQNDRVGWVITQTGDRTFALDFRGRHRFWWGGSRPFSFWPLSFIRSRRKHPRRATSGGRSNRSRSSSKAVRASIPRSWICSRRGSARRPRWPTSGNRSLTSTLSGASRTCAWTPRRRRQVASACVTS